MGIKALFVGSDEHAQFVARLLSGSEIEIVSATQNEALVLDEINRKSPNVVLMCIEKGNMTLRLCQQIYLLRPRSIAILLSDNITPELMQKAMQVGAHYILPLSLPSEQMASQIKAIHTNEETRLSALENSSEASKKSRVIAVFGTKDGLGKTTLAVNLAVKLIQRKNKVALLDFDTQFGDVNTFLGIDTKDTLSELLQEQSSPTIDVIRRYLYIHKSGINVLCAPRSPEFSEGISAQQIEKIISSLRTYYDYIILDTAAAFNEINLTSFDSSNIILLLSGLDISILKNTKKGLTLLESLQEKEKIKLIINKEIQGDIKISDVEKSLGYTVCNSIPYDYKAAVSALNQGVSIVLDSPTSKISKAMEQIVDSIEGKKARKQIKSRKRKLLKQT